MTAPRIHAALQHDLPAIARSIGEGHAYDKHVVKKCEFANRALGLPIAIHSKTDFASHILSVMQNSRTRVFQGMQGKVYFYNFSKNTAIVYDPAHKNLGSCWRADMGIEEARRLVRLDQDSRQLAEPNLAVKPLRARIHAGGISGLPLDAAAPLAPSPFTTPTIRPADAARATSNRYLTPRHRGA